MDIRAVTRPRSAGPQGAAGPSLELRFVAEVPYLAIDDNRFEFPDDGGGPDIVLHLARTIESRTFDGILGAVEDLWAADAFAAAACALDKSPVSVATWTLSGLKYAPSADDITGAFWSRCFSVLDEFSFAYRVVTGWGLGELSPSYVRSPVFYVMLQDGEPTEVAGMLATPGPNPDELVGHDVLSYVAVTVAERFEGVPMVETRRWTERAKDDFDHGFHAMAVIALQTATEVFLGELVQLLRLDMKAWREPPAASSPPASFRNLAAEVGRLVGGDWDRTHSTPWARYWQDLYLLRNGVIHAGLRPTEAQAAAAFDAHRAMMIWLRDLLLKRPRRFTRTLLAYPGMAALMASGLDTQYLRDQYNYWQQPERRYWTDEPDGA